MQHQIRRVLAGPRAAIEYEIVEPPSHVHDPPAVVFIAGLGNHRTIWNFQRAHFSQTHALLFVDNRGIGRSGSPPGWWSVGDHACDVLHVIRHINWHAGRPLHLVGHSFGGLVCYELMVLCRTSAKDVNIASLALVGCSVCTSICSLRPSGLCKTAALLVACDMQALLDASLALNYPSEWLERRAFDGGAGTNAEAVVRFLLTILRGRERVPSVSWAKQVAAVVSYIPSALPGPMMGADDVAAPCGAADALAPPRSLVLCGAEDELHGIDSLNSTVARLGERSRLVILEGAGHNCFVQQPDLVNQALASHFAADRAEPSHDDGFVRDAPGSVDAHSLAQPQAPPNTDRNRTISGSGQASNSCSRALW
jgi:pimeloyl-ACP methyl ester carboxylesterase